MASEQGETNAVGENVDEGEQKDGEGVRTTALGLEENGSTVNDLDSDSDRLDIFVLDHSPVILGTDKVLLNEYELIRNVDYFIEHSEGKVFLVEPILPSDVLSISYDYSETKYSEEFLVGDNSYGPYYLSHSHILEMSLNIEIDGHILRETKDYLVDYEEGTLFFNFEVSYPTVISVTYHSIITETVTKSVQEVPFSLGVTYLSEYVNSEEDDLDRAVISENVSISGTVFQTVNSPIVNTENIVITIGGQRVPTSNYVVSDAYRGEITLFEEVNASALISYDYRRSGRTRYTFVGDGRKSYESDGSLFSLRDVPVKYNGIRFIRVWTGTHEIILENNGDSFEVDYGEDGNTIEISFIKRGEGGVNASLLDEYPSFGQPITIEYDYTSPQSLDTGVIRQRMAGVTMGLLINDAWRIDFETVAADNNFSRPRSFINNPVEIKGSGLDNHTYSIGTINLVDGSEQVFVNNLLQRRDQDYIINYQKGTIKFRDITPGVEDKIQVVFEYYESGRVSAGENSGAQFATRFSTKYHTPSVKASAQIKKIDSDFLPMGPISERKGSSVLESALDWAITDVTSISLDYRLNREDRGLNDESRPVFLNKDTVNGTFRTRMFNVIDTSHSFRQEYQLEESKVSNALSNRYVTDQLTYSWNSLASFGPSFFKNTVSKGFTRSISDYLDRQNSTVISSMTHKYDTTIRSGRVPFIDAVTWKPYYSNSLSDTKNSLTQSLFFTRRQNYGFDSDIVPFKGLNGSTKMSFSDVISKPSASVTENIKEMLNSEYTLRYNPASWLRADWNYKQSEEESPLVAQSGKLSKSRAINISRFSLYGVMLAAGLPYDHFMVDPFNGSYITYRHADKSMFENNDKKQSMNNDQAFSLNEFTPIPGITINKYNVVNRDSKIINTVTTVTTSENSSIQQYDRQDGNLTVKLNMPMLRLFTYTYSFEETEDKRESYVTATHVTSNITLKNTPLNRKNQKLTLLPKSVYIPLLFTRVPFGNVTGFVEESLEDVVNSETVFERAPFQEALIEKHRTEDSTFKRSVAWNSSLSPFNLVSLTGYLNTSDTHIKRELVTDESATFRSDEQRRLGLKRSFFKLFLLNAEYSDSILNQYVSPDVDRTLHELTEAKDDLDFDRLTSFLKTNRSATSIGLSVSPFSFFSLGGSSKLTQLQQLKMTELNQSQESLLEQLTTSVGITIRPLKGMVLNYDYSLNKTSDVGDSENKENEGYSGKTTVTYSPINRNKFKVDFQYTRNDSWGFGFNALDNSSSESTLGQSIFVQVRELNHTEEMGSVGVNIEIPATKSPFIQSYLIQAEGYIKTITDRLDEKNILEGRVPNSIRIGGVVIKGTVQF